MSQLLSARAQMGISLGFHIIFAALGVGLPLLLCIAEGLGYFRKDRVWYDLAQRWVKPFAILYAVGAVSGTILSFELGLLWPTFMNFSGSIIGLPFAMEAFAFFTEGIFLGLYLFGWQRLSPLVHWLCSFPLWIGGMLSSLFVVTSNAWMNTPAGFQIVNGKVTGINPWQAMFNPSTPSETIHMTLAAYEATGFAVAAVYAVLILRGANTLHNRRGMQLGLALGMVVAPFQIIVGDWSARIVAHYQHEKLAAMEGLFHSANGAPETILGFPDTATGQTVLSVQIPHLLSFLAYGNPNAYVQGLDAFPRDDWPDVAITHLSFDTMVGIGFLALLAGLWFWVQYFRQKRAVPTDKWLLYAVVAAGPLTLLAIELGWMVTEEGRQPWIIYHILRVSQAVSPLNLLDVSFVVFTLIYLALAYTTVLLLLRFTRQRGEPLEEEIDRPTPGVVEEHV
jgi:cytochrome d ubiquinol oxidase subunit I